MPFLPQDGAGLKPFMHPIIKENARAAKFIQDELRENLENTTRKAKPINQVYILKNAKKPGMLVEVGFLSNPTEKEHIKKGCLSGKGSCIDLSRNYSLFYE